MIHEYKYNYPTYLGYINLIDKLTKSYSKKYNNLNKKYNVILNKYNEYYYIKLLRKKRQIDIKYIKKIISKFNKILKRKNMVIFFHGSYSKNLNRWNSDIDINFLYLDNKYDKNKFVLEELIACSIYKIFNMSGRDKVHTMMLYLPNIVESNICLDNEYFIKFNDGNIFDYKCRKNFKKIYPKILYSSRKFDDFCNYVLNANDFEEWIYSYKGLKRKDNIIINNLLQRKEETLKNNYSKYFNFIENFKNDLNYTILNNIKTVSDLNKIIKINNLKIIYTMLLIMKEFIVLKNGYCINLDINKIKNNKILKKYINKELLNDFFKYSYKYIWFVDRIENLCIILNINFSSRELSKLDIKRFIKKYNNFYKSNFKSDYDVFRKILSVSKKILRSIEKYEK